jgi:hypothetical protein
MSDEAKYLSAVTAALRDYSEQLAEVADNDEMTQEKLTVIHQAVEAEAQLREKHHVGARFGVLTTQLAHLLEEAEKEYQVVDQASKALSDSSGKKPLSTNEKKVFVYLFNAQGKSLVSWEKMLVESALFEHSVNRPIYGEREQIEKWLRFKKGSACDGYLEITIKQKDILSSGGAGYQDSLGLPLLRIRQGALKCKCVFGLFVNGIMYHLAEDGRLEKTSHSD